MWKRTGEDLKINSFHLTSVINKAVHGGNIYNPKHGELFTSRAADKQVHVILLQINVTGICYI